MHPCEGTVSIPVEVVGEEEFQALVGAIAAAEASSTSCKKPKVSSSGIAPFSSCQLPVHEFSATLSDNTESRCNAYKDESCASSRPLEKTIAAHAAGDHEKVHGNAYNTEALVSSRLLETVATDEAGYHEKFSAKDSSYDCLNQCKDGARSNGSKEDVHFANSCKEETHDESSPQGNLTSVMRADNAQTPPTHGNELQPSSNLKETILAEAPIVDNKKLPWIVARCFYKVKEGELPYFQFKGQIKYSNTPLDAENAAHELLRQIEAKKATCGGSVPLGFDAEWKVIEDQAQKVAVLQLCIDAGSCNVFHVIYSGIPFPLRIILEDPSIFKVGVGVLGDARKIFRGYNVVVNGVKDLNELANLKLQGPGQVNRLWSLSSLAEELLGKQVDKNKSIRMGDWELHNLSEAQLQYAATDAVASLSVFQALLTNRGH